MAELKTEMGSVTVLPQGVRDRACRAVAARATDAADARELLAALGLLPDAGTARSAHRRSTVTVSPGAPWHGKTTGYNAHRCRCDACLAAQLAYQREYRARRRAKAAGGAE